MHIKQVKQIGTCCYCRRPARFVSYTFGDYICSLKCDDAYTQEYFDASTVIATLPDAIRFIEHLRGELARVRKEKVILEHEKEDWSDTLNDTRRKRDDVKNKLAVALKEIKELKS